MEKIRKFNYQPDNSIIVRDWDGEIHYIDSFNITITNTNNYSVDYLTALLFTSIPGWVRMLFRLRDFLVRSFGLKTGMIPDQETLDPSLRYIIGDKAVFFPVIDRSEFEIVMAEDDKHLYFRASVFVERTSDQNLDNVHLTTIVQFHNSCGKWYFAMVKPFHKLIIGTLLTNFSKTLNYT